MALLQAYTSGSVEDFAAELARLTSPDVSPATTRPTLAALLDAAEAEMASDETPDSRLPIVKRLMRSLIDGVASRLVSFVDADYRARLVLANVAQNFEDDFIGALAVLAEMNQSGLDGLRVAETCVRVCELHLELGDDFSRADPLLQRAASTGAIAAGTVLDMRHRVCRARVLDCKRKFIEASSLFYELSAKEKIGEEFVNADDLAALLEKSMVCAILSKACVQRNRMLSLLSKDDRCVSFSCFGILSKMASSVLVTTADSDEFKKMLSPHHLATDSSGVSLVDNNLLYHNLQAAAALYDSISLDRLSELLGLSNDDSVLTIVETATRERRLEGVDVQADQAARMVRFVRQSKSLPQHRGVFEIDQRVKRICTALREVSEIAENARGL